MASLTNKSLNTGSVTNQAPGAASITFDETAPATFDDMIGPFDAPYQFTNKSLNTGSVTNESLS